MEKVLFKEEQRFTQWWLWLIMIITLLSVVVSFGYGIYSQEVLDKSFGDNPMSTEGLIVTGVFSLVLVGVIIVMFFIFRLNTKITNEGLFMSFPPIINKWKKFVPDEIENFKVRKYNAVSEYGGYGMKYRRKYGQAYNISGNIGLQLYLKNGKKVLIGTQRKQAIQYAMEKLMGTRIDPHRVETNTTEPEPSRFGRKAKKILIVIAIEAIIIVLIFVLVQIFK